MTSTRTSNPSGPATPASRDSLWILTVSPSVWAIHLLLSYTTAAIWCEKFAGTSGRLDGARTAIGVYTVIALIGITVTGWIGHRRHSFGDGNLPHDEDTPQDRHRFLGFATLLLSVLSGVATLFVAAVAVFIRSCD